MNTIVLGTNHNNTLGLIWSLGEAGHRITLLLYDNDNNYVSKSKYISDLHLLHSRGKEVIELLIKLAVMMDSKPVIFASNDADATLLNEHYAELSQYCFFEGGRPDGSVNQYRNKNIGNQLAEKIGFTLPQAIVIDAPEQIKRIPFDFPILVKANNSIHGGKSAMKKCDAYEEAWTFVNSFPTSHYPLQVQQFVEKEYEIMLLGCSLYGGKSIICPVANKKIRHYPKVTGLGSYSESVDVSHHKELQQLASKVGMYLRDIEYTGIFSAEFLYNKGEYYFLEINLRNDGTSWLATCSGFNLPDMVCRAFIDDHVTDSGCLFRKMNYLNIMADVNYYIDGTLTLRQFLKQFKSDTCYSHYNKKDKRPFKYYFSHPLFFVIKILAKKVIFYLKK